MKSKIFLLIICIKSVCLTVYSQGYLMILNKKDSHKNEQHPIFYDAMFYIDRSVDHNKTVRLDFPNDEIELFACCEFDTINFYGVDNIEALTNELELKYKKLSESLPLEANQRSKFFSRNRNTYKATFEFEGLCYEVIFHKLTLEYCACLRKDAIDINSYKLGSYGLVKRKYNIKRIKKYDRDFLNEYLANEFSFPR